MAESRHPDWEPITAYVADMSYFSGKMEAYLRYKEIPYERRVVDMKVMRDEILPATGLMKVPVLRLANGQWLKDTTPMIDWLESAYPESPVIPRDPVLRFMSKLVEDYADEWCWRAALYWRWQPVESRKLLMRRIGHEVLADFPAPKWFAGWYYGRRQMATYLRGDGVSAETEPQVKGHYLDLLDAMSELLEEQPFLLGSHPTLVDIGLFGPMFRHYAQDPTPSRVMEERAPAVYAWVGRVWNARAHRLGREPILSDFSQPGWEYFLGEIAQSYWPFLVRNARAWVAGQARVDHQAHGVTYRNLKVVHYRVYCLEVLQNEYRRLSEPNRKAVDDLLHPYGSIELIDGLDSGLIEEHQLPLRPNRVQPSRLTRMKLALMGTPWDMPVKPTKKRESMTDQDSFTPQWFEGTLPKRSYRSAFKWGAPEAYKHPNPRLYALMKETFGLGDEHFEQPQKLGLEEVTADASISLSSEQVSFFRRLLGDENVSDDVYSRLRVSYGKTMIDALRLRDHKAENLPDLVLHPRDRGDVEQIVRYCHEQEIPLYTYAAGSSVTRGTECVRAGVSIHLGTHMKRVLSLNTVNQTVTVEPGILGPDLEEALRGAREGFNAPHAYTCGHFPQSFEFSSAGGWVVTRGAGQNSTYYGKAEDLVLSQEYITPVGTIRTVDVPAYSTGPNLDQLMIGSEGAYGILVAVTLKVFRYQPENTRRFSFIFPDWQSGTAAVREIMQGEFGFPSVFRLSDPEETDVAFKLYGVEGTPIDTLVSLRGFKKGERCLMLGTVDGDRAYTAMVKRRLRQVCNAQGGMYTTGFITKKWEHGRFADPYMREDLQDYGILIDTLECATNWEQLPKVHEQVRAHVKSRPQTVCMTHMSHCYPQGANLYFIFIAKMDHEEFLEFHRGILDAVQASGATMSHHHGIGKMTAPWLEGQIGSNELEVFRALKRHFDPRNVLNPGGTLALDLPDDQRRLP